MNKYYEKNEFNMLDGTKVKAEFSGGQSRNGEYAVDYILVNIGDVELYAEMEPMEKDSDTFFVLCDEIRKEAESIGIDLDYYSPLFDGWIAND